MSLRKFSHMTFVLGTSVVLAACVPPADQSAETGTDQSARKTGVETGMTRALEAAKAAREDRQQAAVEENNRAQAANDRLRIESGERTAALEADRAIKNQFAEDANKLAVEEVKAAANKEISANDANARRYQADRQYSTMNKMIEVAPDVLNFLNASKQAEAALKTAEAQADMLGKRGDAELLRGKAAMQDSRNDWARIPEESRRQQINEMKNYVSEQQQQAHELMGAVKFDMVALGMAGADSSEHDEILDKSGVFDAQVRAEIKARANELSNYTQEERTAQLRALTKASQGLRSARSAGMNATKRSRPGATDFNSAERLNDAADLLNDAIGGAHEALAFGANDMLDEREEIAAKSLYCMGEGKLQDGCTEQKSKELTEFVQGVSWAQSQTLKARLDKPVDSASLDQDLNDLKKDLLNEFTAKVNSSSTSAEATKKAYEAFLNDQIQTKKAAVLGALQSGQRKLTWQEVISETKIFKVNEDADLERHLPKPPVRADARNAIDMSGASAYALRWQPSSLNFDPQSQMRSGEAGDNNAFNVAYMDQPSAWGVGGDGKCRLLGEAKEC